MAKAMELHALAKFIEACQFDQSQFRDFALSTSASVVTALRLFPQLVEALELLAAYGNLPGESDHPEAQWVDKNYNPCDQNEDHALWYLDKRQIWQRKVEKVLKEIENA